MKETLRFFVIGVFLILMVLWACQFQNEKSNDPIYVKVKVNLDKNRSAQLSVLNRVDSLDSGPSYAVVETSTVLIYAVAGGTSVSASSYSTMEYIDRQLMDTSDNTVTLLIPIDTQIKLVLVRFSSAHSLANIIQYTPTASEIKKSGIFTVLGTDSVMTITLLSIQGEVYSGYMGEGIQGTDLNLSGTVTTLAGDGVYASVDGTGDLARLDYPHDIATDGTYLYVVDKNTSGTNGRIRKINIQTSYVSTIAGGATGGGTQCDGSNSTNCYDGTGTAAQFWQPAGITILNGYLYIADQANQRIRQVEIATGIVTTLAGSGVSGFNDAAGTSAEFTDPTGITTDGAYLYVADMGNNRIRKITTAGVVSTLAGDGSIDILDTPHDLTTNGTDIFVVDQNHNQIKRISIGTGAVSVLAGTGEAAFQDSTDGTGATAKMYEPEGITTDGINVYFTDWGTGSLYNSRLRKIVISTGETTTIAGGGSGGTPCTGSNIDYCYNGTGTQAGFYWAHDLASDGTSLFLADFYNHRIRKIE